MSSADIKQVIGILCKQLNLLLHTNKLRPEHFRLSKFDKNDANVVAILWHTLGLLTTRKSNSRINKIKEYMESINYSSPLFYTLPEDSSSGSRELLLAVCFIVATSLQSLIEEEIEKSPFGDSLSLLDITNHYSPNRPEPPNISNEKDYKLFVMWVKGKIERNQNMSEEYKKQSSKMCDKVNKSLNFKADNNLNLNEVLALNDKKYCKEFLEQISFILDLLECYQEWTKKQNIFWKWMVTVVTVREQDKVFKEIM